MQEMLKKQAPADDINIIISPHPLTPQIAYQVKSEIWKHIIYPPQDLLTNTWNRAGKIAYKIKSEIWKNEKQK